MESKERQARKIFIRWMIRRDVPEVLRIETASHDYPWCEEDLYRCLRQRNCIGMVAEDHGSTKVIGFMVYELHQTQIHLINFAVHPKYRRQGVGSQMVQKMFSKLSHGRRVKLELAIRETNLDGQLFFRDCGLRATGVIRKHFSDSGEDAFVMEYDINKVAAGEELRGVETKTA